MGNSGVQEVSVRVYSGNSDVEEVSVRVYSG